MSILDTELPRFLRKDTEVHNMPSKLTPEMSRAVRKSIIRHRIGYLPMHWSKMTDEDVDAHIQKEKELKSVENLIPPMEDILKRVDRSPEFVDSDQYLRDISVRDNDLSSRLRHRATLMRQRADEFDRIADLYERQSSEEVARAVWQHEGKRQEIVQLLEEHAHVEPTRVPKTSD